MNSYIIELANELDLVADEFKGIYKAIEQLRFWEKYPLLASIYIDSESMYNDEGGTNIYYKIGSIQLVPCTVDELLDSTVAKDFINGYGGDFDYGELYSLVDNYLHGKSYHDDGYILKESKKFRQLRKYESVNEELFKHVKELFSDELADVVNGSESINTYCNDVDVDEFVIEGEYFCGTVHRVDNLDLENLIERIKRRMNPITEKILNCERYCLQ